MNTKTILDEKLLQETLQNCEVPQPDDGVKASAIALALDAFDVAQTVDLKEKTDKKENCSQGFTDNGRLKGISERKTRKDKPFSIWRRMMEKKPVMGGMGGAVAACALLILAGGPLILNTYYGAVETDARIVYPESSSERVALQSEQLIDLRRDHVSLNDTIGNRIAGNDIAEEMVPPAPYITEQKGLVGKAEFGSSISPSLMDAQNKSQDKRLDKIFAPTKYKNEEFEDARRNLGLNKEKRKRVMGGIMGGMRASEADMLSQAPARASDRTNHPVKKRVKSDYKSVPYERVASPMYIAPPTVDTDDVVMLRQYKNVGEDEFTDFKDSSVKTVAAEPVSTFSIDVDTASYAFTRRMINNGSLPQKDAVRVEELINYFNYSYPLPESKTSPFQPTVAVYDSPWKSGNKLLHIGIKGHDIDPAEKPAANLVFLIDTSGSMNATDKLPLLINSMKMLVENLGPEDTIGIVTYAGHAGIALEPTKVKDKAKILAALGRLRSGGSTAGAAGIRQAYGLIDLNFDKDAVNRVILATDGDFNVGITNHQELQDFVERKRNSGVFLSVLGFGQGNYHDNLMQTLAQNGNGNASYIDTLSEARKVLVDEASGTLFTIAKDVKIQVEFNPKMVSEYRLIGYETRKLNREDFNNDAVDAGEIGSGHTVTAIYEITPVGVVQNRLVDDLRYGSKAKVGKKRMAVNIPVTTQSAEYAYLKIRYKLPNEDKSKLLTRAITVNDEEQFNTLSDDIRFAAAVAAFGQKLRGGKFIGGMDYDDIIKIARGARGDDTFGYRAEFINLLRLAKSATLMQRP